MLRSEYLRWFLYEEREIPYQNQLQTSFFRRRVTSWAVIFRSTFPCQNRFSVSERRIILNFALQNHLRPVSLPSKIEMVAPSSERPLPTAPSNFTQGNWFLKMNLKDDRQSWFGFQVGCQPFSSSNFVSGGSSDNENLIAPALRQSVFKNTSSLLNA